MDIRLNWLHLKNFKGIKDFRFEPGGENANVYGDNAVGKTTLEDAFLWLVFDKNADNSAKFSVKPLDETGQEIHFLETEVEAQLSVDGKPLLLKKVLTEDWVKPRGEAQKQFKGNKTAYFFDEVPVGANVYKDKISELIDEDTFKLITNPLYFNLFYKVGKLTDWQSRRNLLFEMCDTLTDEDIVAAKPELTKLPEILDGKSVDDRKVILKQSIKKLDEQIRAIGPKIDENNRLIPETPVDYSEAERRLGQLKAELDGIETELANAGRAAEEYRQKQQKLNVLNVKLETLKTELTNAANKDRRGLIDEKNSLENEKYDLETQIRNLTGRIESLKQSVETYKADRQMLLEEYRSIKSDMEEAHKSEFVEPDEGNFVCPTCGQDLPEETKEEKLADMREKFETAKAANITTLENALKQNIANGKNVKANLDSATKAIEHETAYLAEQQDRLKKVNARLAELEKELAKPTVQPDYESNADYKDLLNQAEALLAELTAPPEDTTAALRQRKQEVMAQIEDCNHILHGRETVDNAKARIKELMQSEKDLSAQKSQLEGQLNLLELFERTKAEMLTDVINRKFKHVRFKLFDIQINGGIVPCCETLINTNGRWVPYSDGNSAGKINAGLDIINALSGHYGVWAPIWIDNAESVNELTEVKAQVIRLIVSKDKKLRVEVEK